VAQEIFYLCFSFTENSVQSGNERDAGYQTVMKKLVINLL
jgi:hypothetical protein